MGTPGITAPVASETVPVIVPRSVCANAASAERNKQVTRDRKRNLTACSSSRGLEHANSGGDIFFWDERVRLYRPSKTIRKSKNDQMFGGSRRLRAFKMTC